MSQVVLLAEDDAMVSNFVSFLLQREGFVVLSAWDGEEALQVSRNNAIDLLLTDVRMGGGMNGVELAERIIKEKPGTKVLVMSGFSENELMATEKKLPFLPKPFLPAVLIERVREALGLTTTVIEG